MRGHRARLRNYAPALTAPTDPPLSARQPESAPPTPHLRWGILMIVPGEFP